VRAVTVSSELWQSPGSSDSLERVVAVSREQRVSSELWQSPGSSDSLERVVAVSSEQWQYRESCGSFKRAVAVSSELSTGSCVAAGVVVKKANCGVQQRGRTCDVRNTRCSGCGRLP
jgi:hypothetical protein